MVGGQQQVLLAVHQEQEIAAGTEVQGRRLVVEMLVTGGENQTLLVVVEEEVEVAISDGIETLTSMNHASRHEGMMCLRLHEVIVEVESGSDLEAGLAVLGGGDMTDCRLLSTFA